MTIGLMLFKFGLVHLPAADAADDEMFFTDLAGEVRDRAVLFEFIKDAFGVAKLDVSAEVKSADFLTAVRAGFSD